MLIFGTRTSHIARVMHIIVLSVVTMVTYINLSRYICSVSAQRQSLYQFLPLIMSNGGHQLLLLLVPHSHGDSRMHVVVVTFCGFCH